MPQFTDLPPTMKALVFKSTSEPLVVETVPVPEPTIGSAVVRVLATSVISYARQIFTGERNYPSPKPLTPGSAAIGRVAAVGIDATKLQVGDLVFVDTVVRSRDDPSDLYLAGIHEGYTDGSRKLMRDVFRDWTLAEYCRAPLESLTLVNETRLTASPSNGGLGYSIGQLSSAFKMLVPYGGLRDIELSPGETVIVAPATGPFGGAAVLVALAMGARVIAMGRNKNSLATLEKKVPMPERVETVPITGDMELDCQELKKHGTIDAYFDIGPPEAHASSHIKSCILSLRHGGRVSLMGGYREDIPIPHAAIMHRDIRLYGKWMYGRKEIAELFKLVEHGLLRLDEAGGLERSKIFALEEWQQALDTAAEDAGFGKSVVTTP